MRARVTPDDLAAGTLLDAGWYSAEIVKYEESPANTDGSTNAHVSFKVIGDGKGDPKGKGVGARFRTLYNEKAMGFAAPLLKALGAKVDPETGIDADLSEATLLGKRVDVNIRRGETNRKTPFNEPVEFAPLGQITKFKG